MIVFIVLLGVDKIIFKIILFRVCVSGCIGGGDVCVCTGIRRMYYGVCGYIVVFIY